MKKTKYLFVSLVMSAAFLITGCSWDGIKDALTTSSDAVAVSNAIDVAQADFADEHSINKTTLEDLDVLQSDIAKAIKGKAKLSETLEFYDRAVVIYNTLYAEAIDRSDELTGEQRSQLNFINIKLLALNDKYLALTEEAKSSDLYQKSTDLLYLLSTASTIFKVVSGAPGI